MMNHKVKCDKPFDIDKTITFYQEHRRKETEKNMASQPVDVFSGYQATGNHRFSALMSDMVTLHEDLEIIVHHMPKNYKAYRVRRSNTPPPRLSGGLMGTQILTFGRFAREK